MNTLKLEPITAANFHLLEKISLTEQQIEQQSEENIYKTIAQAYVKLHHKKWLPYLATSLDSEKIYGHVCLVIPPEEDMCSITALAVTKEYQGMGVGTQLMEETLSVINKVVPNAKFVGLLVAPDNMPAVNLYKKFRFKTDTTISSKQGKVMRLTLKK